MTVTENPPEVADAGATPLVGHRPAAAPGLAGALGGGDHKVAGRLYVAGAAVMGLLAGLAGVLFGIDRIDQSPGDTVLNQDTVTQVVDFHTFGALFLFVLPLLLGVAMVVVPLQVGAQTLAFPRAAMASFTSWLLGSGLLIAAYAMNGGPGGGSHRGVGLWVTALILVAVALVVGAVAVVTTVLTLRAPGMTLDRIPLFSWSMVVTGVLWILTLPVLIGMLLLSYVDHRYGQQSFGVPDQIGDYVHWVFVVPQVYAWALPVLGLLADTAATSGRVRLAPRQALVTAIGAASFFAFGAFLQPAVNQEALDQPLSTAMTTLFLLVVLAIGGLTATSLRTGATKVRFQSGFLFGALAWLLLVLAALAGVAQSFRTLDLQGTVFEGGQAHLTLLAATLAGVGGLWYWGTKVVGRVLPEGLGKVAAAAIFLGALGLALPDLISGAVGDHVDAAVGIEALNVLSLLGGLLLLVGVVAAVAGVLSGLRSRDAAPADPWDGLTLEWRTPSPPPFDNFETVPEVTSAEPLLDGADTEEASAP